MKEDCGEEDHDYDDVGHFDDEDDDGIDYRDDGNRDNYDVDKDEIACRIFCKERRMHLCFPRLIGFYVFYKIEDILKATAEI